MSVLCAVIDCVNEATVDDWVDSGRYKVAVCQKHYDEKHKVEH